MQQFDSIFLIENSSLAFITRVFSDEKRWRKHWLKNTAGNYFLLQSLLIFSDLIYKFTDVCTHIWTRFFLFLDGQSSVMLKVLLVWSEKKGHIKMEQKEKLICFA